MIRWRDPIRCRVCEQPTTHRNRYCGACQARWPRIFKLVTLGYYGGPLRRALHIFKYGYVRGVGEWLGEAIGRRTVAELGGIDRVVPVPGGVRRRRQRGFDPSTVIAESVARWLSVPLDVTSIRRVRDGPPLSSRTRLDREIEVSGRFAFAGAIGMRGQRVLVVDDVYTTGVSLDEVSRLILEGGRARSVVGAVVARAVVEV